MSTQSSLFAERFLLTTKTHGTPLVSTMKKYTRASDTVNQKDPGTILFLGHGAGFRMFACYRNRW